jgi:predicted lactoylglutathione lyase
MLAHDKQEQSTMCGVVIGDRASCRPYRSLGLDIPDPMNQPPGALHTTTKDENSLLLEIDNEYLASIYNAGVRQGRSESSVIIGVAFESREQVDATYAKLVADGYQSRQPPYDAFWGSRYAIVVDPEGNNVGLMSPPDDEYRSWPPTNSPALWVSMVKLVPPRRFSFEYRFEQGDIPRVVWEKQGRLERLRLHRIGYDYASSRLFSAVLHMCAIAKRDDP